MRILGIIFTALLIGFSLPFLWPFYVWAYWWSGRPHTDAFTFIGEVLIGVAALFLNTILILAIIYDLF